MGIGWIVLIVIACVAALSIIILSISHRSKWLKYWLEPEQNQWVHSDTLPGNAKRTALDGDMLATSSNGDLMFYKITDGNAILDHTTVELGDVEDIAITENRVLVCYGTSKGHELWLYDLQEKTSERVFVSRMVLSNLCVSMGGFLFGVNGDVYVLERGSTVPHTILEDHPCNLIVQTDRNIVIAYDDTIEEYDRRRLERLSEFKVGSEVHTLKAHPNGNELLVNDTVYHRSHFNWVERVSLDPHDVSVWPHREQNNVGSDVVAMNLKYAIVPSHMGLEILQECAS